MHTNLDILLNLLLTKEQMLLYSMNRGHSIAKKRKVVNERDDLSEFKLGHSLVKNLEKHQISMLQGYKVRT